MNHCLRLVAFLGAVFGIAFSVSAAIFDSDEKPNDNRFTVVPLTEADGLNEPMSFEVLKDGRAFIIERRGGIKVYDPSTQRLTAVGMLAVNNSVRDGNGEQGLVGMTVDPNFEETGWIYLYYQHPVEEKSVLSRWMIRNNVLVANSEIVMLEWAAQRDTCCHTGGGITWDDADNLLVTIGNNRGNNISAHTDERPGREAWDDQGGSANSNSLEGKIVRIHPEPDGTYSIPPGNLFAPGTLNTRPEIYTMGHRNAWRVSIDSKTGFVYWGEVGPDATEASDRGPNSYDEFNQARGPGFFGWPYFIGDDAYPHWDYFENKRGALFDPAKPMNNSPNNTGIKRLPPLSPTFIHNPYEESERFPALGSGRRSATGGPIYRRDDFENSDRPWPEYFEGKWIATDFSRRLIVLIEMDGSGDYVSMERFLPEYDPVEPIDMKFGPEGDLYVLEYGGRWFQGSPDARLTRIEFEQGNRTPIAVVSADKAGGIPPFAVQLSSRGTVDFDHDSLTYAWEIVDIGGSRQTFAEPNPNVSLEGLGTYVARLTVTDPAGASDSQSVRIVSGNEPPTVKLKITGNSSFFFPGKPFDYQVEVVDREDGTLKDKKIRDESVALSIDYASADFDVESLRNHSSGDPVEVAFPVAMSLIAKGNCMSCHLPHLKLVGPSYLQIAEKYLDDPNAPAMLAKKIVTGGLGSWGKIAMPPNAALNESDAGTILEYILSLAETDLERLPLAGTFDPMTPEGDDGSGMFIVRASYTDNGVGIAPSLSAQTIRVLRSAQLEIASADVNVGVVAGQFGASVSPNAHLGFWSLDLTGITRIDLSASAYSFAQHKGGDVEIRLDSPTGALIGEAFIDVQQPDPDRRRPRRRFGQPPTPIELKTSVGIHDVYVVFQNSEANSEDTLMSVKTFAFSH